MKNLQKFALVLAKFMEVLHWIGAASMAAILLSGLFAQDWLLKTVAALSDGELSTYGFSLVVIDGSFAPDPRAVLLFAAGGIAVMSLTAMIFRNVYLMLKTVSGTNPHTRRATPFQHDMIRMIREIGIFFLSIPAVSLVLSIIARLTLGDGIELSIQLDSLMMGIFVLCLTQAFRYGMELEHDVDGLV
ncbi:MAG: hypothetical protein HFG45_08780 [Oscillospiraceae bacterium]|jgi:hypothetical protein|nr:hypothetical protein [Oscillospiraceae bacterium]